MKQNNCYSIVIPVPRCHPGKGRSEKGAKNRFSVAGPDDHKVHLSSP